jgi:hypothetical protein
MVKEGFLVPAGNYPARRGGSPVPCFRAVLPLTEEIDHPPKNSGSEKVRDREIQVGTPGENQGGSPRKSQDTTTRKSQGQTRLSQQEIVEKEKGNQTNPPTPLVGLMVDYFIESTLTAPFYNEDDGKQIELLAIERGDDEVQRTWKAFFHRAGGLGGAKRPFRLFISEFQILQQLASELESCQLL